MKGPIDDVNGVIAGGAYGQATKLNSLQAAGYRLYTIANDLHFIVDPLDDSDGYSITGSDVDELINEAYRHLISDQS